MLTAIVLVVALASFAVALLVVLRRVLGRYATSATAHLQELSRDYLARQDELKARLEESERQYQQQLVKAREEAERMRAEALQEIDATRQRLLSDAREEGERIVQKAVQSREAMKRELEQSAAARAVQQAAEIVRRLLPPALRQQIHGAWVEELLQDGMEQWPRMRHDPDTTAVTVRAAFALTAREREALERKLKALLGRGVELREETAPELLAGLMLVMGSVVLDGTLASKLQQAVREIRDAAEG
ncbi:MAG TPA: F0F1 ATP synthase subunit delta [bacterium]